MEGMALDGEAHAKVVSAAETSVGFEVVQEWGKGEAAGTGMKC